LYSPETVEELRGISEGAEVTFDEIMITTSYIELQSLFGSSIQACTAFAATPSATADHLTYVGQNNDEKLDFITKGDCTILSILKSNSGPDILDYTYAGAPASMGINSCGLCECANGLPYERVETGVPILCVAREILNQTNLDDAVSKIMDAKIAVAANFVIGTDGRIANVEANPSKVQITTSESILFHTNHYLCSTSDFAENIGEEVSSSSLLRCNRMENLLKENIGKLDLPIFQSILKDHENSPNSICAHKDGKLMADRSKTIDSMIFIPEKRQAWIAKGNPCEAGFERYEI
jgi:isopenicillin-N N-acyltransferase like protein